MRAIYPELLQHKRLLACFHPSFSFTPTKALEYCFVLVISKT